MRFSVFMGDHHKDAPFCEKKEYYGSSWTFVREQGKTQRRVRMMGRAARIFAT
jgi:hypothetical protein